MKKNRGILNCRNNAWKLPFSITSTPLAEAICVNTTRMIVNPLNASMYSILCGLTVPIIFNSECCDLSFVIANITDISNVANKQYPYNSKSMQFNFSLYARAIENKNVFL